MITHYEVLGVKEDATGKEIRQAYRRLATGLHPDKNIGVNEMVQRLVQERFLEVQEACATLSDPAKRKEYDAGLAAYRSEGEYYTSAAPNDPAKRKEPARCDNCRTIVGEPMRYICGVCRRETENLQKEAANLRKEVANLQKQAAARAALEEEVKIRRACKLCGLSNRPLDVSPVSGVCLKCWLNIENEVRKQDIKKRHMRVAGM